jgi:starch-binding outer membrane protein, SusD/RagB family
MSNSKMMLIMKNLRIYLLAMSALVAGSCGDSFLDSEPITQVTDANFYKTPQDAYKALVGCYDGLQIIWSEGISFPVASEVFSDNTFGGTGNSDGFGYQMIDEFDKNRSTADPSIFNSNWNAYYKAVYRCNVLLSKLDQINWDGDDQLRATYEAETRFIRAFLYFDMVRLWGNIPLLTVATADNVPQAEPSEVYKTIAEDLKFAIQNLEATSFTSQPEETYGRVTKWAAESLAARVFLYYTGYYDQTDVAGVITKAEALSYVEDVIANSGHGLVENFEQLWPAASVENYAGENNREVIFSIKYTFTSDYNGNVDGNHWMVMNGMREQAVYPYGNGWGGATVNAKLWEAYADNDSRKSATVISIEDEEIAFENVSKQREYTGYYNKKYTPLVDGEGNSLAVKLGGVNFMIGQYQDYFAIRYADVLLMAAELGSPNAQTYFDDVRKRAYKTGYASIPATIDNIMTERHLEFALEGIRYWDLLRQGADVAANTIAETTELLNGGTPVTKTITAARIQETKGLQQIPNAQITLSNNTLQQNAGW